MKFGTFCEVLAFVFGILLACAISALLMVLAIWFGGATL